MSSVSLRSHTFFVDRSLGGVVVARSLRHAMEHEGAADIVITHDDHFEKDTEDDVWLRHVGEHDWIALSKDDAITRKNAPALVAIVHHGVRMFVLLRQDLKGEQMAHLFVGALPVMRRILVRHSRPFVAPIDGNGRVKGVLTEKKLLEILRHRHGIRI